MGKKDSNKKGKQKEPTGTANPAGAVAFAPAPPPPPHPPPPVPAPSPPPARHILPITIDTIEEEAEYEGLQDGPIDGEEEWQNVGQSDGVAADGWTSNEAGNSNGGWGVDVGSEAGAAPSLPMPPLPAPQQKGLGSGKTQSKQQQQHQLQRRQHPTQHANGDPWNVAGGGWNDPGSTAAQTAWNNSPIHDGWGNPNDEEDEGSDDQLSEDDPGDEWNGNAGNGWGQQVAHSAPWPPPAAAHSTHSHATSQLQPSTWRGWSDEARRLPKVTFDPPLPSFPPSTGDRAVLSQTQRTRMLNALLNKPQQSQQPPNLSSHGTSFHAPPAAAKSWQQQQTTAALPPPHLEAKRPQYQPQQHSQHHHPHQPLQRTQQHHQREQYGLQEVQKHPKNQHEHYKQTKTQKKAQQEQEVHDAWGIGGEWHDQHDDDDYEATHDAWGRKVHFSPARTVPPEPPSVSSTVVENFTVNALPSNKLGLSAYPISRTLSYAYSGTAASFGTGGGRNPMPQIADVRLLESQGEALNCVRRAFYSKSRKAEDRFHWLFPPEKDERVRTLLTWIQSVSFSIASFGLQKFLQTRERGALIINADYRPLSSMNEPVVDWISWDQIQPTMDRILQESVGYYNPAIHIIIFVFLPSPSGNSLAIWRRKIPIPNSIRLAYQAQITQAVASLRKDYPVLIDQLPPPPPPAAPPEPSRKKRKWYKLWLST